MIIIISFDRECLTFDLIGQKLRNHRSGVQTSQHDDDLSVDSRFDGIGSGEGMYGPEIKRERGGNERYTVKKDA